MTRASAAPKRRRRRRLAIVFAVLVAMGLFWVFGFTLGAAPEHASRMFSLGHLRAIAGSRGDLPVSVGRLVVARAEYPHNLVVAGWNIDDHPMAFASFQVRYENRPPIIIDAPHESATHDARFGGNGYDDEAWQTLQRHLAQASHILFTHEHLDHVRGVTQSPDRDALLGRVWLTQAQRDHMPDDTDFGAAQLEATQTLQETEEGPSFVAPGIVRVPAPGHTPGSVFYYVLLRSGRQLLFVGDTAWSLENIDRARGRAWVVSAFLGEDREATHLQLRDLRRLRDEQPHLAMIPAHDDQMVRRYIELGVLEDGFIDAPPPPAPEEQTPPDEADTQPDEAAPTADGAPTTAGDEAPADETAERP